MVRMASYECGVIRFMLGLCCFVGLCWFQAEHSIEEWTINDSERWGLKHGFQERSAGPKPC